MRGIESKKKNKGKNRYFGILRTILNDRFIPSVMGVIQGFELGRNGLLFKKTDLKRD